jgi:hypothetical protein
MGNHMKKPWLKRSKFRIRAAYLLRDIGLRATTSLNGVKNVDMWRALTEHYGSEQAALEAMYLTQPSTENGKAIAKVSKKLPDRHSFYDSDDWKRVRYQALVKHGAACQCCGATRADGVKLHVDHIKPRSKYPELELSLDNLQILCEPCNMGKRAWDETDWREHSPGRGMVLWAD